MASKQKCTAQAEKVGKRLGRLDKAVAGAKDGAARRLARKRLKRAQRKKKCLETLAAA